MQQLDSAGQLRHNLPAYLPPLIGREHDLEALQALVLAGDGHLLTLTGTGGSGKTRMALELAQRMLDAFPEGVWVVELATVSEPALVPQTVAAVLGARESAGRSAVQALFGAVRDRSIFVVLDNCEHLIDACASLSEALVRACPGIRLLATSREPLRIPGENTWRVSGLPAPDPEHVPPPAELERSPAVQLFVVRARAVQPNFTLTVENGAAVAQVCAQLDGLPLALELAAARVRALAVEQLAARLGDVFSFLTGGSRTAPTRQQTLRGALDWSYELLAAPEQTLFRRLAVFAGGWDIEAAEKIAADDGIETTEVLDLLTRLVDKSLVVAEDRSGVARYRLLEPIRQYAVEHLRVSGDADAVRSRHLQFFMTVAEEGYRQQTQDPGGWLRRLTQETDNLRTALDWATAHSADAQVQLVGALAWFWLLGGCVTEGGHRLAEAVATRRGHAAVLARALSGAGSIAGFQGDMQTARSHLEESLTLRRELGDQHEIATTLDNLGFLAMLAGDHPTARRYSEEELAIWRELGDERRICQAIIMVGQAAWGQGDRDTACGCYQEGHALASSLADPTLLRMSHHCLADVALFGGAYPTAAEEYAHALALGNQLGIPAYATVDLEGLAMTAASLGQAERALRLAGAAAASWEAIGITVPVDWWDTAKEHWLGLARGILGPDAAALAWSAGRALSLEDACRDALAEVSKEPVEPTPAGSGGLTRREREVAVLLAQGLSNRQIAEQLVIAEKTAAVHVEHILGKLDLHSRWQVGDWAVAHGLISAR